MVGAEEGDPLTITYVTGDVRQGLYGLGRKAYETHRALDAYQLLDVIGPDATTPTRYGRAAAAAPPTPGTAARLIPTGSFGSAAVGIYCGRCARVSAIEHAPECGSAVRT